MELETISMEQCGIDDVLLRIDDNMFSYKTEKGTEIRIETPSFSGIANAYLLSRHVHTAFGTKNEQNIQRIQRIHISNSEESVNGYWHVAKVTHSLFQEKIAQKIPMLHIIAPKHILHMKISRESIGNSCCSLGNTSIVHVSERIDHPHLYISSLPLYRSSQSIQREIQREPFNDEFTRLATTAFQSIEPHFVFQKTVLGELCYQIQHQALVLIPRTSTSIEQNQRVISFYTGFIEQEYGKAHVQYIQDAYGFSFEHMHALGEPLLPDHIFRVNIGVNNIELHHVEELIKQIRLFIERIGHDNTAVYQKLSVTMSEFFCIREIRGLIIQYERYKQQQSFAQFLHSLVEGPVKSLHELSPQHANALIEVLLPDKKAYDRLFTGRKIHHLAICGYHTQGDKSVRDPCRDLFELLHIFPQLSKQSDWNHFKELCAHVVVKKTLAREYYEKDQKETTWKAGYILPAPTSTTHETRYYYVEACVDNNLGNTNYVLLPVCHYKEQDKLLPMIKLYRSTASDKNAFNSYESLAADLNPLSRAPLDLDPHKAYHLEHTYFTERTIPTWVGYLLYAEAHEKINEKQSYKSLIKAFDQLIECIVDTEVDNDIIPLTEQIQKLCIDDISEHPSQTTQIHIPWGDGDLEMDTIEFNITQNTIDFFDTKQIYGQAVWFRDNLKGNINKAMQFLRNIAFLCKELPEHKIHQDIHYVGHSLGAALSQFGFYYFGPRCGRIPLPNCHFDCYALNGPAIAKEHDTFVRRFVLAHRGLLTWMKQKWNIYHRFEYGDIVPQAGERHLGTVQYPEDLDECLTTTVQIFRPVETTSIIELSTMPTHGRRLGSAIENTDYTIQQLSQKQMKKFHKAILPKDLKKIFGFKILTGPKVTEKARRIIGIIAYPFLQMSQMIHNTKDSRQTDTSGIFFTAYTKK